ncbi:MAG: hypothetical protein II198_02200 [Bacteroidaceae bacterium]|nr:hypothetical protein [Bacteroidaceae bacterium]
MLHGSFANGRYTSTVLFVLSMLVLSAAYWLPDYAAPIAQPALPLFMSRAVSRVVSTFIYLFAAVILSQQTFFDREVKWKGALYFWFVAVMTFVNGNPLVAVASLLFLLSIVMMFHCQHSADPVRLLYTSFLLLGVLAFITPFALWLIPLYLLFCSMVNIFSARGVAASLLGVITPFWLVMGTAYVFPRVNGILDSFVGNMSAGFEVCFPSFSLLCLLLILFVLAVLLPALFTFVGGTSPSKPFLRRRFSFVLVANVYLLLLYCIFGGGAGFLYVCQLPFVAIEASFLFARKETKLSNVYFVLLNTIMLAIASLPLWLSH